MNRRSCPTPALLALAAASLTLAGCLPAGQSALSLAALALAALLAFVGCTSNRPHVSQQSPSDAAPQPTPDAERLSPTDGLPPPPLDAWLVPDTNLPAPPPDAQPDAQPDVPPDVARDVGGFNYPCCIGGRAETCYCAPQMACNYAPFVTCPDGTCSYGPPYGFDASPQQCQRDAGGGQ